jgi:hypothetical protein
MEIKKLQLEKLRYKPSPNTLAMLGIVALAAPALAVAADRVSREIRWRDYEATVDYCSSATRDTSHALISLPGLGVQDTYRISDTLAPAFDADPVYVGLPEREPSMSKVGQQLEEFVIRNDIERVSFFGHSMGGVKMIELLPYLPHHVKVENMFFDCTPMDKGDVIDPRLVELAYMLGKISKGGVISSMAVAAIMSDPDNYAGPPTRFPRLRAALDRIGKDGGSPETWMWQIGELYHANDEWMGGIIRERVPLGANIVYIMPADPAKDETVGVLQSASHLEYIARRPVHRLLIPNGIHALREDSALEYYETIADFFGKRERSQLTLAA